MPENDAILEEDQVLHGKTRKHHISRLRTRLVASWTGLGGCEQHKCIKIRPMKLCNNCTLVDQLDRLWHSKQTGWIWGHSQPIRALPNRCCFHDHRFGAQDHKLRTTAGQVQNLKLENCCWLFFFFSSAPIETTKKICWQGSTKTWSQ